MPNRPNALPGLAPAIGPGRALLLLVAAALCAASASGNTAAGQAHADALELRPGAPVKSAAGHLYGLDDPDRLLDPVDALHMLESGEVGALQGAHFGRRSDPVADWIALPVVNVGGRHEDFALALGSSKIYSLRAHVVRLVEGEPEITTYDLGLLHGDGSRLVEARHFIVPFDLEPGAGAVVLLSNLKTRSWMDLSIGTLRKVLHEDAAKTHLALFTIGLFAALAAYHLIVFLRGRETVTGWYTLAIFSYFIYLVCYEYPLYAIAPDTFPHRLRIDVVYVAINSAVVSLALFTRSYLDVYRGGCWADRLLLGICGGVGSLILAILSLGAERVMPAILAYTSIALLTNLTLGIRGLLKGVRTAGNYMLGYGVICGFGFLDTLSGAGLLPSSLSFLPIAQIGALLSITTFSIGLADRLKHLTADLREARDSLEERVAERTSELLEAQAELTRSAMAAGKAEVATSILHNVGNVLNGANVSAQLIDRGIATSRVGKLRKAVDCILEARGDLAAFAASEQGQRVLDYVARASEVIEREHRGHRDHVRALRDSLAHAVVVVHAQQEYATARNAEEQVPVPELIDDALRIVGAARPWRQGELEVEHDELAVLETDRHKVVQILVNLLKNAREANSANPGSSGRIAIHSQHLPNDEVRITIEDDGCGIAAKDVDSMFRMGFTTKKSGHGFGLHSSINTAVALGGSLAFESAGRMEGATFMLTLPCKPSGRGGVDDCAQLDQ